MEYDFLVSNPYNTSDKPLKQWRKKEVDHV